MLSRRPSAAGARWSRCSAPRTSSALIAIRDACNAEGISVSDRRWKKSLKVVQATAFLAGESATTPEDPKWHLIQHRDQRALPLRPGEALPQEALFMGCSGGTSIGAALSRGLELVRDTSGGVRKADLALVSDGIDEDTADASALRDHATALGVSVFGLAIGMPSEILAPWCDEAPVTDLSTVEGKVANAIFP